eukprot:CAMPEP_0184699514 /NCGR_PEP_ID=MMETSP0313-20130426/5769_1 /TAXON_ID=2792 /ORGANISM="Porphyridium aerugineum, Strain SAG 1380-2" /LENGTH=663 /DNA_ID=CAMNT_0027158625 /DNA_START=42 /DNA_END=2030 /DNA_ORIENTATION=-
MSQNRTDGLLEFGADDETEEVNFRNDHVLSFASKKGSLPKLDTGSNGTQSAPKTPSASEGNVMRSTKSSVGISDSKGNPMPVSVDGNIPAVHQSPTEAYVTRTDGGGRDATHCAGCSSLFGFSNRKHVCRSCNASFCGKCSSQKKIIPSVGPEPVRVCDVCFLAENRRERIVHNMGSGANSYFTDEATIRRKERHTAAMEALNRIYKAKIKPVEQAYKFSSFYASEISDGDFDSRPMVLLVGQYSVGKTSFIKYLLERDFPGQHIGPEPTTDRFLAVTHGRSERIVPGNAAAVDTNRPFQSLTKFGTAFLNRFEVSELPCPLLDSITLIDTPGILSGEKQRVERGYEFEDVVQWFAERSDRILILFDAHKLDISDELKRVIEVLKGHEDKIRIVLNKADSVAPQQLMRIYGALMWSLGKVVRSPEVMRVYLGSFWDQPLNPEGLGNADLFNAEKQDLLADLRALPRNSAVRKVNELIKRARLAKVHALLISHLWSKMPYLWGSKDKQKKLMGRLEDEYVKVQKMYNLAPGDFPNPEKLRAGLSVHNLSDFPKLSSRLIDVMDGGLTRDIPKLLSELRDDSETIGDEQNEIYGAIRPEDSASNPFAHTADFASGEQWVVDNNNKAKWDNLFYSLNPQGTPAALPGAGVRGVMLESGLPSDVLRK